VKIMRFEAEANIGNVKEINPLFSLCDIYVCYPNLNRNNMWISKEAINDALYSLKNVPIVGEYLKNKDNFGDHGGKIENEDGKLVYVETTMPYGVVPESAIFDWELVTEKDGTINEYLVVRGAYLWTGRYKEAQLLIGQRFNQSMEINIEEGSFVEIDNKKVFEIRKFIFSALCILGIEKESDPNGHVEPCFESASIIASSLDKDKFKQEFNQMIKELKFSLSISNLDKGGEKTKMEVDFLKKDEWGTGDKIEIDLSKEAASDDAWGSVDKTALRNSILKASNYKTLVNKCYLIVEDGWEDAPSNHLKYPVCQIKNGKLVYNINGVQAALQRLHQEGITSSAPIDKLKKIYRKLGLDTSNFSKEGNSLSKKELLKKFKLTYTQMYDEFNRVLGEVIYKVEDWWSGKIVERQRYFLRDFDESYVYVCDCENDYIDVKLPYSVSGDNITIDYSSPIRIKYTPTDWDGGLEDDPDYDNDVVIDSIQDYAHKVDSETKEKFASLKQQQESMKQEYEEQINSLKQEYEAKLQEHQDTVFAATSKLESANNEIEQLKELLDGLSAFKAAKLEQEKNEKVDSLIEENSKFFSVEEIDEWRNKGKECDSFESFEKEFKLAAFAKIKEFIKTDDAEKRFAFIEKPEDKSQDESDVFSRLKNKFEKD